RGWVHRRRPTSLRRAYDLPAAGRGVYRGHSRRGDGAVVMNADVATRHYILATAGHVDHGKSALVHALTGVDPDRLPEEKARGITIDLGFAHLELSSAIADPPATFCL